MFAMNRHGITVTNPNRPCRVWAFIFSPLKWQFACRENGAGRWTQFGPFGRIVLAVDPAF